MGHTQDVLITMYIGGVKKLIHLDVHYIKRKQFMNDLYYEWVIHFFDHFELPGIVSWSYEVHWDDID